MYIWNSAKQCEAWDEFTNWWEDEPSKMADEMQLKQPNYEVSLSFLGHSCILIVTANEMTMYNDKLAPDTEPRSVTFFSA